MSTLNKTNPKIWAERRIPCFAGTGDRSLQQNYYAGKPSSVGKGLDPFRKIQRTERYKTVPYAIVYHIKTERHETVPNAIVQHIKTERRIPCFAGTGDHSPQQNYYAGKPSFVGKGLDPFRKIQRTERYKTVCDDNRPPHQNGTAQNRSLRDRLPHQNGTVQDRSLRDRLPHQKGTVQDRSLRDRPTYQNGTAHTLLCGHRRPFPT